LGVVAPVAGVFWMLMGMIVPDLMFHYAFGIILGLCLGSPVFLIPCGVALYAYGKLMPVGSPQEKGLCPKCAYPIGSSPVCTECGAKLPLPREGEGRGQGA